MTIVAIDGPAAAGKGTLARRLAAELGFDYLDTGLIYRAVGMNVARAGQDPADPAVAEAAAKALAPADLQASDLRNDDAAIAASKVAAIPAVRAQLLEFQRRFAAQPPGGRGAVLDGRDIGTVVCPDAEAKLFVTASLEKRAERRLKELRDKGLDAIQETVLA
ncbi:MAG TPA: (d)CMP kinase, partial [Candidatus Omnitrophota bacterium]|nr:(d)CMP kinase [Candidatus Omnitrophota bacterium]